MSSRKTKVDGKVREASLSFEVGAHGRVTGAIHEAPDPIEATLLLAHGAGAPRTHPFMVGMARRLARHGVDVVTFNFVYAEAGRRMPDRVELLEACFRAAIRAVRARGRRGGKRSLSGSGRSEVRLRTERLFIGGKSMGGRIATHLAAAEEGLDVAGVVLLGYPLHPLGKPKLVRDEIFRVRSPMLVVQGTRDALGTAAELKRLLAATPNARVHVVAGGDHSLAIPKREGPERVDRALEDAARAIAAFLRR